MEKIVINDYLIMQIQSTDIEFYFQLTLCLCTAFCSNYYNVNRLFNIPGYQHLREEIRNVQSEIRRLMNNHPEGNILYEFFRSINMEYLDHLVQLQDALRSPFQYDMLREGHIFRNSVLNIFSERLSPTMLTNISDDFRNFIANFNLTQRIDAYPQFSLELLHDSLNSVLVPINGRSHTLNDLFPVSIQMNLKKYAP